MTAAETFHVSGGRNDAMLFNRTANGPKTGRRLILIAGAVAAPLTLAACSTNGSDIDLAAYAASVEPADVLYNQGLANMNAGRMSEAIRKFDAVDRQHPYSEFARRSLIMNAFANYRQGNYEEAVTAGQRYVQLYPTQDDAAYAQYLVGLSHFRQIRDVTRDQRDSRRTIEAMETLVQRWPDSEYVEDAQVKIRFARDQIAGKEMQVGRYYLERREYLASIKRFRNVVEFYSNTNHVEEALARLVEAYFAMGLTSEAQTAAAVLGHNYPDSEWYRSSYTLLQSGGLEPREDRGSWLSRAGALLVGA
jgi:outer membrane protein assembly factor BamD